MAMGTLADLEDQDPIPGKENPLKIHLKVSVREGPTSRRNGRMDISQKDELFIKIH